MKPENLMKSKINELMYNDRNKYDGNPSMNTLLESDELKRKLSLTSFLVSDLAQSHPVAIVSPQYILVNPKILEKFLKTEGLSESDEYQQVAQVNVAMTNFVSDLLKQSMGKPAVTEENTAKVLSHKELIDFVALSNPKQAEDMDKSAFNVTQWKSAQNYISKGGDIESIPKFSYRGVQSGYVSKLFDGEVYLKNSNKDVKTFLKLYENNKDEEVQDYIITGIAAKVVAKTTGCRTYVAVKAWDELAAIAGLSAKDYPSIAIPTLDGGELRNDIREKIAHAANSLIDDNNKDQRDALIAGISSFSKIQYMFDAVKFGGTPTRKLKR